MHSVVWGVEEKWCPYWKSNCSLLIIWLLSEACIPEQKVNVLWVMWSRFVDWRICSRMLYAAVVRQPCGVSNRVKWGSASVNTCTLPRGSSCLSMKTGNTDLFWRSRSTWIKLFTLYKDITWKPEGLQLIGLNGVKNSMRCLSYV